MKKTLVACAIAASAALCASGAWAQSHGGHGGGGGWHGGGGGGWHGGGGGGWHGGGGSHWSGGGGHWNGGGHWSGNRGGGRFYGRPVYGHRYYPRYRSFGSVFIGVPWFWPSYYAYPYYYDYPTYYYDTPATVYVDPQTSAPATQSATQYYCPDTGYYPTVKTCPQGWLRVVPDEAPPQ